MDEARLQRHVADAVIGIDTLWGGDVMNPSGMGRFIADSWFSDAPLPRAYTDPTAARLRELGGVSAKTPDREAIDRYLATVDVREEIAAVAREGARHGGVRGAYLETTADCLAIMFDLAMEVAGKGAPVPYERCVEAVTGAPPTPSQPVEKRRQLADLLAAAGPGQDGAALLAAVDAWRAARMVPKSSLAGLGAELIATYDRLSATHVVPYLPADLASTPRANVTFLPIENAWFSGSMNYLGRARRPDGSPEYEATYEINAALQISLPELHQLVSHEVVPGHVTTFAYLQRLYVLGKAGFEGTVTTMNTRSSALYEGIANNAILMAHGVREVHELPDRDVQIGVLLALLQDDAKNQSSYLTWKEGMAKEEVARVLRNDFLVSEERADKLSGAWGRHPLLGRMMLPIYRAGTEAVAQLRREYPPERVLPALFGAHGLVDAFTIRQVLA